MNKRTGLGLLLASMLLALPGRSLADIPEAADRAFSMAAKYSAMSYYMTPSKEGWAGFGVTLEFTIPVNVGLDYIFLMAGDHNCLDPDVWIETENGNVLVKDTRKLDNGLCGVRWRSDYNGTVNCVVHFARVSSRCGWAAVLGRRGTATNVVPGDVSNTTPGATMPARTQPVQSVGNDQ